MYDDNLKSCLIKLVNHLKSNKANNRKEITVLLGAGCSLSSSNKDISTSGIIRDLVNRYSDENENIPKEWTKLYEQFVNKVWMGQGNKDRIQLLEEYFKNMSPSVGYQQLRYLIENNYINNIITTNFDPMLEEVLTGLSYYLQVGTYTEKVGENPQFTLLKAHGDLKIGQLRFAPSELYRLPKEIEETIGRLTDSILIIVGYRGQDMGIVQSLNEQEEHCAYWISYYQPDFYNDYENGAIINWLKKRNSEKNILYGLEYGDFDTVFSKICFMLQQETFQNKNQFLKLWENSYVNDYLQLNLRFHNIFSEMLCIIEDRIKDLPWKPCSLYYADSHYVLVNSSIKVLNDKVFPKELLYCISNEVNGLLFAIMIEIWCCCQGYNITSENLIKNLKHEYEKNSVNPHISSGFWEALEWLCQLSPQIEMIPPKAYYEIVVSFDAGKNLEMILKKISLMDFSSLLLILQRILLFTKTSGVGTDVIGIQNKKFLESHLYQLLAQEKDINIQLSKITQTEYRQIFNDILNKYFAEQIIGNRHILYYRNLYVQVNVEVQYNEITLGLMEELIQKSHLMKTIFLEDFQNDNELVWNKYYKIIDDFLDSNSIGLFISGDSGIGKTWFLKRFVAEASCTEYLIFPIEAKRIEEHENVINCLLGNELINLDKIKYINIMLKTRYQQLVLIIDGINEIDANLQQILSIYKSLTDLCDFLSKEGLDSIRIVITCRTEFCYHIQNNSRMLPSPSSFYSIIDENGNATTIYQFPQLNDNDISHIMKYISCDINVESLKEKFGDIIYIPLYLNMLCRIIKDKSNVLLSLKNYNPYQIWYSNLQKLSSVQGYSFNAMDEICNYIIYYKYFTQTNEILTTSELFMRISLLPQNGSNIFEWMVKHKILKSTQLYQNIILFTHDKIEEFFLMRYIQLEYKENLVEAVQHIIPKYFTSPIVQNSIHCILDITLTKNFNVFLNYVVYAITKDNQILKTLIINLLLEEGEQLYEVLKKTEQFVCRIDLENFLYIIFEQIEKKIINFEKFPFSSVQNIKYYIHSSLIGNSPVFLALIYYNYAKFIWTFPIETVGISYATAITHCEKVNQLNKEELPLKMLDKNNQLLAVLLRNEGKLNEAADLMFTIYNNQYQNACFNEACQAALDLGAIYRELTLFDKALELYTNYPVEFVTDLQLKNRLYMNIGIIYKNKVQNDLFNKEVDSETTYKNYRESKKLFEQVYDYAREVFHVPLLLEILAELVESTVVGYYLNMATISKAVDYVVELDNLLPKYPIPVRQIQNCRMWARVLTLQGKSLEAIERLKNGFQIAVHYNIPFRAADCCNQISGILCDNIHNEFVTKELIVEGIEACRYSIDYYSKLHQSEHIYLSDSRKKMKVLKEALKNII